MTLNVDLKKTCLLLFNGKTPEFKSKFAFFFSRLCWTKIRESNCHRCVLQYSWYFSAVVCPQFMFPTVHLFKLVNTQGVNTLFTLVKYVRVAANNRRTNFQPFTQILIFTERVYELLLFLFEAAALFGSFRPKQCEVINSTCANTPCFFLFFFLWVYFKKNIAYGALKQQMLSSKPEETPSLTDRMF